MEDKEKKAIIALWGPQGRGKTTTLRKLALEFLDSPEVKEDIQIGFLFEKKKIVVSTAEDDQVNTSFCEELGAHVLVTATRGKELGEECAQRIIVHADLIEEVDTDEKQGPVSDVQVVNDLISSIANNNEITTLRQFSLQLLKTEVVKGDIQIAFHYEGKRIVISTAGDDGDVVNEGGNLFKRLSADMLVTTTRDRKNQDKGSIEAVEALERDDDIRTKAIWIYKSYLMYGPSNDESLKESITEEQIEIIRNMINEEQAKTIKLVIDNIIEEWEK